MTHDALIAALTTRFPDRRMRIAARGDIVFPAAHPAVGDLTIKDDGDEWTAYVGDITHSHLRSIDEAIEFVEWLFADRVLMWTAFGAAGWRLAPSQVVELPGPTWRRWFVWSKPL